MTPLVQICIVVVTIAVVVVSAEALRLLMRVERLARDITQEFEELRVLLAGSREAMRDVREFLGIARDVVNTTRFAVQRAEDVAERATGMANDLLDEVEGPVRGAVALVRGLRSGATLLRERWLSPRTHNGTSRS